MVFVNISTALQGVQVAVITDNVWMSGISQAFVWISVRILLTEGNACFCCFLLHVEIITKCYRRSFLSIVSWEHKNAT